MIALILTITCLVRLRGTRGMVFTDLSCSGSRSSGSSSGGGGSGGGRLRGGTWFLTQTTHDGA
jgi:hypothetical protein